MHILQGDTLLCAGAARDCLGDVRLRDDEVSIDGRGRSGRGRRCRSLRRHRYRRAVGGGVQVGADVAVKLIVGVGATVSVGLSVAVGANATGVLVGSVWTSGADVRVGST